MSEVLSAKLDDIYQCIGWPILRTVLGEQIGITANGMDKFKHRLSEKLLEDANIENKVDVFWQNLIYGGNKLIRIYKFPDTDAVSLNAIDEYLKSQKRDTSAFWYSYPYALEDAILENQDCELHFSSYDQQVAYTRAFKSALFVSKAYYTSTTDLSPEHLSDTGKLLLENGAELVCKQRLVTQCNHSITLDIQRNMLILAVDTSVLPASEANSQMSLLRAFIDIPQIEWPAPLSLFGAIQKLYQSVDGRIAMMSFITPDGNGSELSLKRGQKCLKQDSYHHGGEIAAGVLTMFKIKKLWDLATTQTRSTPIGLALFGKKVMLDSASVKLVDAELSNCLSFEHTILLVDKLMDALGA